MSATVYHRQVVRVTQPVTRGLQKETLSYELKSVDTALEVDQVLSYEVDLAIGQSLQLDLATGKVGLGGLPSTDLFDDKGEQLQLGRLKFLSVVVDYGDEVETVDTEEIFALMGINSDNIDLDGDFGGEFFAVFAGLGTAINDVAPIHLNYYSESHATKVKVLLGGKLKVGATAAPGELG